jgi:hypothetical protein
MRIPADLPRRWRTYWPDADVERMARDVEARVDDAIAAWGLTGAHPLPGGHVGAVLATRDLVLKVSPRGHDDDVLVASQPDALEHWRPTGIVPVLHGRRDDGFTYLMQRVRPGTALDDVGLPFEARLRTLGLLAARLHAAGPAPAAFVPLADYARPVEPRRAGAVDPHATRGDRHADVWALLDPLVPAVADDATALRWVAIYAEAAGLDPERARAWVHVRAAGEAGDVEPDDPDRAVRLRRMAAATSPS